MQLHTEPARAYAAILALPAGCAAPPFITSRACFRAPPPAPHWPCGFKRRAQAEGDAIELGGDPSRRGLSVCLKLAPRGRRGRGMGSGLADWLWGGYASTVSPSLSGGTCRLRGKERATIGCQRAPLLGSCEPRSGMWGRDRTRAESRRGGQEGAAPGQGQSPFARLLSGGE